MVPGASWRLESPRREAVPPDIRREKQWRTSSIPIGGFVEGKKLIVQGGEFSLMLCAMQSISLFLLKVTSHVVVGKGVPIMDS